MFYEVLVVIIQILFRYLYEFDTNVRHADDKICRCNLD